MFAIAALALALAPTAFAAPSLTLTENCDEYPPNGYLEIHLEGLPPNAPLDGTLSWSGSNPGSIGPVAFNADGTGSLDFTWIGEATYTVTVEWAGGTLMATKQVDCALPAGSPVAHAGQDQRVTAGTTVLLDGSGSSDPDGDPLTYSWTQTGGPRVTLSGAGTATPSFTAPSGPAALSFELGVCDDGSTSLCDTDEVTVEVEAPPVDGNDYAARVIVRSPTWANGPVGHRRQGFVVKVTNLGTGPFAASAADIATRALVDGSPNGSFELVSTKVAKPGKRVKFRYAWRHTGVKVGDEVELSACVEAVGDPNAGNDCGSHTATAGEKP